jgi:hypothetical protein
VLKKDNSGDEVSGDDTDGYGEQAADGWEGECEEFKTSTDGGVVKDGEDEDEEEDSNEEA